MYTDKTLIQLATSIGRILTNKQLKLVTAESCTGGWLAQTITEIPGCSSWFDRGFITYSNNAKIQLLHVLQTTLEKYGAVSKEVAEEMVRGACTNSEAEVSVSVTGIAGPGGGSAEKPVGTIWIGCMLGDAISTHCYHFTGDRHSIRAQAVNAALIMLQTTLLSCSI